MDEKRRHRRDFVQNIVITVLALSAAVLMAQTQLYNLGSAAGARSPRASAVAFSPGRILVAFCHLYT